MLLKRWQWVVQERSPLTFDDFVKLGDSPRVFADWCSVLLGAGCPRPVSFSRWYTTERDAGSDATLTAEQPQWRRSME